jgi:hypothetical protein
MELSNQQLSDYAEKGFLVLNNFVSVSDCDELCARTNERLREFDPASVTSIFSTHEQNCLDL